MEKLELSEIFWPCTCQVHYSSFPLSFSIHFFSLSFYHFLKLNSFIFLSPRNCLSAPSLLLISLFSVPFNVSVLLGSLLSRTFACRCILLNDKIVLVRNKVFHKKIHTKVPKTILTQVQMKLSIFSLYVA